MPIEINKMNGLTIITKWLTPHYIHWLILGITATWNNRFGRLTSVRYPQAVDTASRIVLGERMAQALDPQKLGIAILPVREQAWASVAESQDFGGLFIGFSFFLILAALVLMNLPFQFVIEQRTH